MLIELFMLNKKRDRVIVKRSDDGSGYEYIHGDDLYMEPADVAVNRIARESLNVELKEERLSLVRSESSTVVNNGACSVMRVVTYLYRCESDDINLSDSSYEWHSVEDIVKRMCYNGRFYEAAYLIEVCGVD